MVTAMANLLTHEIVLDGEQVRENCLFREKMTDGEFGPSHRCHLQDYLNGVPGARDMPITTSCEPGEIPDVCPMLTGDFKISLGGRTGDTFP